MEATTCVVSFLDELSEKYCLCVWGESWKTGKSDHYALSRTKNLELQTRELNCNCNFINVSFFSRILQQAYFGQILYSSQLCSNESVNRKSVELRSAQPLHASYYCPQVPWAGAWYRDES